MSWTSTGDIEPRYPKQPSVPILVDVDFFRRGRVWVHPDADFWVDRVGKAPEAPYEHDALRSLMSRMGMTNKSNEERVDGPNA